MIVAFSGPAGAGKSTAARGLNPIPWRTFTQANVLASAQTFVLLPLAIVLKEMIACIDPVLLSPELKEVPNDLLCGKSPRFAMKTLGTEWGRDTIGEALWLRAWLARAEGCPNVVVDDLRFENEYEVLAKAGAKFIEIARPGVQRTGDHPSESYTPPWDVCIPNRGSVEQLHKRVRSLVWGEWAA